MSAKKKPRTKSKKENTAEKKKRPEFDLSEEMDLPEEMDFNELSEEEIANLAQIMLEGVFEALEELAKRCETPLEAQDFANRNIRFVHELSKNPKTSLPPSKILLFLTRAAWIYQKAGYKEATYDLLCEAIRVGEAIVREDISAQERSEMEGTLGALCYRAGCLAMDLNKDFKVVDRFFEEAYENMEKLEAKNQLEDPELYGMILVMQKSRMFQQGRKEEAEKLDEKIKKYATPETIRQMEEAFKNR